MAFKITEECISCGACESECPNKAISEGSERYEIDAVKCTECVGAFNEYPSREHSLCAPIRRT